MTDPANKPYAGWIPNANEPTTPITFWQIISKPATNKNTISGFPPLIKREKFALKPIEVKNTNIMVVCKFLSKLKDVPSTLFQIKRPMATINPPTTGSGMLNVFKMLIRLTRK